MEPIAQIILTIAISIAVILIIIIVLLRGIKFKSDKINIDLDGNTKEKKDKKKEPIYYVFSADDMESIIDILSAFLEHLYEVSDSVSLQKKMDIVENRLPNLFEHKIQFFYNKLIIENIPLGGIANHIDYLHYRQVVDRILYLDDAASPSVKSTLIK